MIGDSTYFKNLLLEHLPHGWFDPEGKIINALAAAMADPSAQNFALIRFVSQQTRLQTSTEIWLDILADDWFGKNTFKRRKDETDDSYRARIKSELLRARATREAMEDALRDLTGYDAKIFEPNRIKDTGCYGDGQADKTNSWGFYFNTGEGGWGAKNRPFEFFVTATRPLGSGFKNLAGWADHNGFQKMPGGYGEYFYYPPPNPDGTSDPDFVPTINPGRIAWADSTMQRGNVTDADIEARVKRTRAAGIKVWLKIKPPGAEGAIPNKDPIWVTTSGSLGTYFSGSVLNITVKANDPDGLNPITYELADGSSLPGTLSMDQYGRITGSVPNLEEDTTFTFTINAIDERGGKVARQFSLTIIHENKAPIWQSSILPAMTTGLPVNYQLLASDPEGQPVSFTHTSGTLPPGVTMTPTGLLTGMPYQAGSFSFTVRADDGWGGQSVQTITQPVSQGFAYHVGTKSFANSAASFSGWTWPTGTQPDDLALIWVPYLSGATPALPITGTNPWREQQIPWTYTAGLYIKKLNANDLATPPTITHGGNDAIIVMVYRAVADAGVRTITTSSTATTLDMGVIPTTPECAGLVVLTADRDPGGNHVAPAGFIERDELTSTYFRAMAADLLAPYGGGSLQVSGYQNTSYNMAIAVELVSAQDAGYVEDAQSIPAMTGLTSPFGHAVGTWGGTWNSPVNAFDGVNSASSYTQESGGSSGVAIGRAYEDRKIMGRYRISLYHAGATYAPTTITFEGSNDNANWTALDYRNMSGQWTQPGFTFYDFDVPRVNWIPFKYHRLRFNQAGNGLYIAEIQFLQGWSVPPKLAVGATQFRKPTATGGLYMPPRASGAVQFKKPTISGLLNAGYGMTGTPSFKKPTVSGMAGPVVLIGNTASTENTTYNSNTGHIRGSLLTATATGKITTLAVNLAAVTGTGTLIRGIVYSHNTVTGLPDTRLGYTANFAAAPGVNSASMTTPLDVTSGTQYWIVWQQSQNGVTWYQRPNGAGLSTNAAFSNPPPTIISGSNTNAYAMSATIEP